MHVFLCQALNEVFAENLQFPRGLNPAKIAFLTLWGFNSNKPPLYYGSRSHCFGTTRKSFIGKEKGRGGRETGTGQKGEEAEGDGSPGAGVCRAQAPAGGGLRRGAASPSRCQPSEALLARLPSHAPTHPLLLGARRSRDGQNGDEVPAPGAADHLGSSLPAPARPSLHPTGTSTGGAPGKRPSKSPPFRRAF